MRGLLQDFRYGVRMLAKSPGFTVVAVLTLALGIGANTAIFSAVSPILFEPLPYPHASRIVMIWDIFQGSRSDVTFHTYRELVSRSYSFDAVSAMEPWRPTVTGPAEPERLEGQSVSAGYFRVLGISPALGRDFQTSDDLFHGPRVVILSNGLWQRRFSGDRGIIGRGITLDGDSYEVIGVMPRGFENVLAPSAEIWSPLQYNAGNVTDINSTEWGHHLRMFGRLRPGVNKEKAALELGAIAGTPVAEFLRVPWAALKSGFMVDSLQDEITRGVRPALLAVFGAVLMVLTIACVNVTNLLLARGAQRRAEFAMRAVLGAAPVRMLRQVLTESLLLSGLGGLLGIAVARIGVQALLALAPQDLPRVNAISLDGTVFAFGIGLTALIGLAVGLAPALYVSRRDLQESIQLNSQRTIGGHQTARCALVVVEVSLAVVLLVSAGLLLRSLERLFAVDPGFQSVHVLTMQVQTSGHKFDDESVKRRFFNQALEEVSHVPGVSSAAFTSLLPLSDKREALTAGTYGTLFEKDQRSYDVFLYAVTADYFQAMGIPLVRGRFLDKRDVAGTPQAVVISESLAKSEFSGEDPIGQRVHIGPMDRPWYTVVGVVRDVKQTSLAMADLDAVYIAPEHQWFANDAMSFVVRTRGDALALAPAIRKAVWSVDKDQAIIHVATMDSLLAASAAERKFVLVLFEAFGLVALLLAATGIYGVLSGSVTERFREIGIRAALGASRASILVLVVRQGMVLATLGSAIGLVGAAIVSQAMMTLLFGISRLDPITYGGVIGLLGAASAVSCWVPLSGTGEPEVLRGVRASANIFDLLGTRPTLGRAFRREEDEPGRGNVMILTEALWRSRFQSDPAVIGKSMTLDGVPHEIVGVMPASFRFPQALGGASGNARLAFFQPLNGLKPYEEGLIGEFDFVAVARLKPGATREQALAELNVVQAQIAKQANEGVDLLGALWPLEAEVVGPARRGLIFLLAAVGAVLLIVCVNLASLLLARVPGRMREAAIRTALGATRARLIRQMLAETLLLSFTGGAIGTFLASVGLKWIVHLAPVSIPRLDEAQMDARVLVFTLVVSIGTGAFFGLLPALRVARSQPVDALKSGGAATTESRRTRRLREGLVGFEVGLTTLLLVLAGLLMASLGQLLRVHAGFTAENALVAGVSLPPQTYSEPEARARFYNKVLVDLQSLPGVRAAGWVSIPPLGGEGSVTGISVPGAPQTQAEIPVANYRPASTDYFSAMGIPLLQGRIFGPGDRDRKIVLVSQSVAERFWPGKNPVGQICITKWGPDVPAEVVGVVGDIRTVRLDDAPLMMVYVPEWFNSISAPSSVSFVMRAASDPANYAAPVREVIHRVDADVPVTALSSMKQIVSQSVDGRRFPMMLAMVFASSSLLLAALGIFGVVGYSVEQRRQELGIRMALGANLADLLRMVLRQGMAPVAMGVGTGGIAAIFAGRLISSLLFGVTAYDPFTFASVALLVGAVAFLACYIPAQRATKVDPMVALRYE